MGELLGAFLLVIVTADAFTNAVEWIDTRTKLTTGAAGAVVAAIASSLPETIVAFVALVVLRDARSQAIGIGAVIGAPFMLSTVIFSLIGILALSRPRRGRAALAIPTAPLVFSVSLFFVTFALALAASFVRVRHAHVGAVLLVIIAYLIYLYYHLRILEPEAETSPPPLRIAPTLKRPPTRLAVVQLLLALGLATLASRWLVASLSQASLVFGIAPFTISLIVSPLATELPEAMNVMLWLRRGQDELAMNNVLGAMMFQTSIACSIAMLATPWALPAGAYAAGVATLVAAGFVIVMTLVRKRVEPTALALAGLLYVAYLAKIVLPGTLVR